MDFININGLRLFAPRSREEVIQQAFEKKKILVAVNAEKILMTDNDFLQLMSSNIGYPDGFGAVALLKKYGFAQAIKIPGVELWLDIIKRHHKDKSFYLIGAKEEVINKTVSGLKKEFNGINIVGYRNGYMQADDVRALKNDIKNKKPDVIFVAMGSPRQENLMKALQSIHPAVYLGLGGSFDVYTGKVKRAPKWWIDNNLEWAFRLISQPKRIRRQIHLVKIIPLLFFGKVKYKENLNGKPKFVIVR
ncbi:WecB/TagA/CpsF family glycosyltransferase [Echinicola sp. CAU 1574]|uniref:WecB/TagA/CpsF family glycosyltransferase n=1 Tax=Echinicola arenosa TaxID=2774144 RepID=A0ABR9AQ53_9BACT|nr:WecB/TagA/CpsF family glycosyltransferase [Echinicola arenosa]MBD8490055.1 WecB/TagA/CpsF family glycosyltransferase [Echinicola arenosa]